MYVEDAGDRGIPKRPAITGKPAKPDDAPKTDGADSAVPAQERAGITAFFTTFFTLYPAAAEQAFSYHAGGGALPVIANDGYVFAGLVNPVFTAGGNTVTADAAVQHLGRQAGTREILQ